jgi:hypothetical protein
MIVDRFELRKDSVPAQNQRLDGKQQGLDAQQHRVHEADGVDGMQQETLECAGVLGSDAIVVAGIGVDDAARAWRDSFEPAFIVRLEKREDRARLPQVLRIEAVRRSGIDRRRCSPERW